MVMQKLDYCIPYRGHVLAPDERQRH